ncbi:MAG: hypothetical protein ACOYYI_04180 [Chloroflexota bacterium]
MSTFDLTILPLHRQNGQAYPHLPGLLAVAPPRKTARGRERDSLVLYLMLSGNADFAPAEVDELVRRAADLFYQTHGSLTFAMRRVAEAVNAALLERNLSTTGRGQYALGSLILASVRENLCTLSLSGPVHVVWVTEGGQRHIHEPALSGRGLGSSQSAQTYFSQIEFKPGDLLALCGKFPKDWEADLLYDHPPALLEASYRKLMLTKSDVHAALIQPQSGRGVITILRPEVNASRSQPEPAPAIQEPVHTEASPPPPPAAEAPPSNSVITEEELDALAEMGAHFVQPSAYAIPPRAEEPPLAAPERVTAREFPPSIPRIKPSVPQPEAAPAEAEEAFEPQASQPLRFRLFPPAKPDAHAEAARQMAKAVVGGIRSGRRLNERIGDFLRRFIPKLLPGAESAEPLTIPNYIMVFMAVFIPLAVSVVAWLVYSNYGLNETYRELYQQALVENAQASSETDPVRQRDAYLRVLERVTQAEQYRETDEIRLLRSETQAKLDTLMGVVRLEFIPAFPNGLGGAVQISRMAASESDLYMLNAESGAILHASFNGRSLEYDAAFTCQPGTHGGIQVGTIVDILALPKINAYGASVLGIDTSGALIYCTPGQVPRASKLPALPNLNWGRITAFTLDNDTLYILDAETRSVWVYRGKSSAFNDPPYFFFGNQIPDISTAIDLAVSGDDLYLLHADGHLSTCAYSRIAEVPTRCTDPAPRIDNFPAHRDMDIFAQAHFTQMALTSPPNPVVLLLDAENRSVFRLTPRSLELQNQVTGYADRASPFQPGPVSAMTISPNYVLYLAIGNQVYFAVNLP